MRDMLVIFILLILFTGCATAEDDQRRDKEEPTPGAAVVRPSTTPHLTPISTSAIAATMATTAVTAASPTPDPTATLTPTPTLMAVPIIVEGNPRAPSLRTPVAQEGAVCGLVDLFDFPLDAPHARNASGGGDDFGIFRSRFDGHHAGEDWWVSGGRTSLGAPVYSIGHGEVTYAEPLGWGRDKGVVIVRHTLTDGSELLSFYGHLDPDSLKVAFGSCVVRGDLIGKIGRPTTGPHLHFEVRSFMPFAPGRGYLPDDPTLAGWKPPSATIWNSRMEVSPGVLWTQPYAADGLHNAGASAEEIVVFLESDHIAGIDMAGGSERWRMPVDEDIEQMLLDVEAQQIYTANQFGEVSAFALPDIENGTEAKEAPPLWTADFDVVGIPTLMPLPGSGLLLSAWDHLLAISAQGKLLWEADLETRPYDWLVSGDTLFITTNGGERPLGTADANGWQRWDSDAGGHLAAASDNVLLYDRNALYRLDPENHSLELMHELSGGTLAAGDVAALPGGGAIIAHVDRADRRLIALDSAGKLLWERSVAAATAGDLDLFTGENQLFLVAQNNEGSGNEVSIFALDVEGAQLAHLFTGGTRSGALDQTRLFAVGDGRILIDIDGRSLTLLDTNEAQNHKSFRPVE